MVRSLRWRLLLWYAVVLAAVVGGFAGLLYGQVRAARFRDIDARLTAAANYLDSALRIFPPHELTGALLKPLPPSRVGKGEKPPRGGKDKPPRTGKDKRPYGGKDKPPPGGKDKMPHGGGEYHPPRTLSHLLASLTLPDDLTSQAPSRVYFAVWRADSSLLVAADVPAASPPPQPSEATDSPTLASRGPYREAVLRGPGGACVLAGTTTADMAAGLTLFAWQLTGVGAAVLGVGLLGVWLVSSRIVQPLARISATASRISAANLSERIDEARVASELAELAGVLNATFDRLQAAFDRQARFTADASHELRTPLAVIRSQLQLTLARPRPTEEYRETLAVCLRATERMTGIVEGLLTLARADANKLLSRRQPVALDKIASEGAALLRPLADERSVTLTLDLDLAWVAGDAETLARVVNNLLSNAILYNRAGGHVWVQLTEDDGMVLLTVADTGCGIPDTERAHVFERFYRVDKARARSSGGTGLGLAICKSIIEAHDGAIGWAPREPEGALFWVRLPRLAAPE